MLPHLAFFTWILWIEIRSLCLQGEYRLSYCLCPGLELLILLNQPRRCGDCRCELAYPASILIILKCLSFGSSSFPLVQQPISRLFPVAETEMLPLNAPFFPFPDLWQLLVSCHFYEFHYSRYLI